jgi:hypothetical protein
MFTWKRERLVRGLVGSASGCIGWWLFYALGTWSGIVKPTLLFICFFFCVVGIDRILGTLVALARWGFTNPHDHRSNTL